MPEIDRTGCRAPIHGTRWAYAKRCRCPDAKRAKAWYAKRHAAGVLPSAFVDVTGARRRIRSLQAIGYSLAYLARRLGYRSTAALNPLLFGDHPTITRTRHDQIDALFRELCMTPGSSKRSVNEARRKGWPPPLAWDCIDTDPEPSAVDDVDNDEVDRIAVARVIAGQPPEKLRIVDRRAAVVELTRRGRTSREIAGLIGCSLATVDRDRVCQKAAA